MANIFRQATSWIYTALSVSILGTWSLLVLAGVGLTALDSNAGLVQLIALPSLLTFLVAKLIVAASPSSRTQAVSTAISGNLATWIATADNGSPHGALVLLLFSAAWLLHLARIVFVLFTLALMLGFYLFAAALAAVDKDETASGRRSLFDDEDARGELTTAMATFERTGINIEDFVQDKPWLMFQMVAGVWAVSSLLMMYLVAYGFGALRKVLTTPLERWARDGEGVLRAHGSQQAGAAVVIEKERVTVPTEAQVVS
ncbi:hypothetical protein CCHL11_02443 [Colletotrichum chlorophyti]|uniref:Uncharacterized protein n=1 Tax=Colletotrichum chlorophyti TaxID=708187 RepID=A0A1Q8S5N1_9PEZI|nr:hypothetical protein CCHL11_02443 [Colletotrichum chlorophyti]